MEKHFTTSVYVLTKINGEIKVLLHKHPKLNKWFPVGGHIDYGENPQEAAIRETKEETNLDVSLVNFKRKLMKTKDMEELILPITLLQENIPVYKSEKAHQHIDSIYFAKSKNPKNIKMKEEYGWFSIKDLNKMPLQKEVKLLSQRALTFVSL